MYKSVALRITLKSGQIYISSDNAFDEHSVLMHVLAIAKTTIAAREYLEAENVVQVDMCYANPHNAYNVSEEDIYYSFPMNVNGCNIYIENAIKMFNDIPILNVPTLEILPDCVYDDELNEKLEAMRKSGKCIDWKKQDKYTEWDNNGWWYLHGLLQDDVHYDKGIVINATAAGVTKEAIDWHKIVGDVCESYSSRPCRMMHLNGIVRCKVLGVSDDCLGFFYTENEREVAYEGGKFNDWMQRGYVVAKNDREGLIDAYYGYLLKTLH